MTTATARTAKRRFVGLVVAVGLLAAACSGVVDRTAGPSTRVDDGAAPVGAATADAPEGATEAEPGQPSAERVVDRVAYDAHLELLRQASVRNANHDASPFRDVPSADLVLEDHYGPRSEYLVQVGGNVEPAFPTVTGGQFRIACEFSHFAYDDPLLFPDQPGAAHLHMFFGNTDANAYSTYDTLLNSGSSTCNGQELNRTAYWVPAMFDGEGNVRVPERIVIYYKGEGFSNGKSVPYPPEAAFIATENINGMSTEQGGAEFKLSFVCSDQWSTTAEPWSNTMPDCDGDHFLDLYGVPDEPHVVLEVNVKFPQCWNGDDPADWTNYSVPTGGGGWYASNCTGEYDINLPNLEYFVNYRVHLGESTADWYLSSDVRADSFELDPERPAGSSTHGDWWGAWHGEVNQMWIDNCVNFSAQPVSGCGFGYLTDGGPDQDNPLPGPALKYRPQYTGPDKVPAEALFAELCSPMTDRVYTKPSDAAYCIPNAG